MAQKKYLSLERLAEYDALLKAKMATDDAATLEAAKEYADELVEGVNTAITSGNVVVKEAEHAVSADSAVKATQDANGNVIAETYETKTDAASKLEEAKEYTDEKLEELESYVGTIPSTSTATNVVAYVQEKTAGIATEGAMTELSDRIGVVEGDVATIKGDYLKGADKTELQNNINGKVAQTAYDAKVEEIKGTTDSLQTQINTIMNNPDTEGVINSINEFAQYISDHGEIADGFREDIDQNKDDIDAVASRVGNLETASATYALKTEVETVSSSLNEYKNAHAGDYTNSQIDTAISGAIDAEEVRVDALLDKKVDKVDGKGLSTNDLTNALKENYDAAYTHSQAAHAPSNAQANIIETVKVNGTAVTVTGKAVNITVPTDNTQLTNGAGYLVASNIANKADKATTLAGYGITDAYTSVQTDTAIATAMAQFEECTQADIQGLFDT